MKKRYYAMQLLLPKLKATATFWLSRSLNAILIMLLMFGGTLFGQKSNETESISAPWAQKGYKNEITSKRNRTSKQFMRDDNTISAFFSTGSLHYLDEHNMWKDISTSIIAYGGDNGAHPYAAEANSVKTYFPLNPFSNFIVMKAKEGSYTERVKSISFLDASSNVLSVLPLSNNVVASVQGNKITYTGFYPNLSLEYTLGNDSRKFNLNILSPIFLTGIPAGATQIAISEEFISANGSSKIENIDQHLRLTTLGTQLFEFERPIAYDSNSLSEDQLEGNVVVNRDGHATTFKSSFDISWINNSSRTFPLHLDPTVSYYPLSTTYWTGYQTSSSGKSSGMLRLTTTSTASWAKFDLAALPPGASVTNADYYGYHYSNANASLKTVEIRGMGTLDPVSASASALFTQSYGGPSYNNSYTWGGPSYAWHMGSLNSTALTDIAAAAGNWIAMGFGYVSGYTSFQYQYGINSTTQRNYIEVIYYTTPCAGAPATNTIWPTSYTTCAGFNNPNLTLVNTYSVGGISYQWLSSTVSNVGPFTPIPGATLNIAPTPTLGVTTWFQAVITCSNGGGNITLPSVEMNVAGTTTNSIPYYEDFEGIQTEDRLPNCSWYAANSGSSVFTYTAPNTNNRLPYSGNNFASFGLPSNNNIVYSNGLELNPGIEYRASIMWATEYAGYSNWTDLSILVGPNQSSSGLVQVASVSPAISGGYQELAGTFTVPSSGLYYIAIQANSTSGSALYLSWDDLRVTIPCEVGSPNMPNLNLSVSNATICEGESVNLTLNGADTYSWSSGQMVPTITEYPMSTTTYYGYGTNATTGCTNMLSQMITVLPSPDVFVTASPPFVCAGEPVILNAYGALSYAWSSGAVGPQLTINPTASGTYSVIGTNAEGCSGMFAQQITVNNLPTVAVTKNSNAEACADDELTFSATGALTYYWNESATNQLYWGSTISIFLPMSTTFTVTGTDANGCENTALFSQDISACTSIHKISGTGSDLNVFPNPTKGNLKIESTSETVKTFELIDLTGRTLYSVTTNEKVTNMNLQDYANGVYYLKMTSDDGPQIIKVVKQ